MRGPEPPPPLPHTAIAHASPFTHHAPPPQQRQRPLQAAAGNPSLTNADQTVTKVDKTDHPQPPPQPQTPAKHSTIATAPPSRHPPASTPAVNPSAAPTPHLGTSCLSRRKG